MSEPPPPEGPCVTGQMFVARIEYLRQNHGQNAISKVMAALPEEDRERLRGVEASGWYPFRMLVRFDRAVARVVAPTDPGIFERLGSASAQVRNEWLGEHASLVSPHAFLSRVAEEHRRYHTFGRVSYRRTGFTEGELTCAEYPEMDETFCLGARGYLRATVELVTRGPARIEERECQCRGDAHCRFWIQWAHREPAIPAGGAA